MSNFEHNIYKNNPVLMKDYVGKYCAVKTTDKREHVGTIYTIDPVSESVFLIEESSDSDVLLKVIIGHAVENIEIISSEIKDFSQLFCQQNSKISESFVANRKKMVINILEENRVPVKETDENLIIGGILSIKPPYALEDCVSTNSIVLTRIRNILSQIQ